MTNPALGAVADLLDDRSYHIEFNGHLTNHVKHAVIALAGIGAPEHLIRDYYTEYARLTAYGFPLEPKRTTGQVIDAGNWREYLGQRVHFTAYHEFFDTEVRRLGIDGALATYAPELLHGWIGAFTHATIHLGWAVWAGHPGMTAEALAYLTFSAVPVTPGDRAPSPYADAADPWESLLRLSAGWAADTEFRSAVESVIDHTDTVTELHPELRRSGLQARVAAIAAADIPALADTPAWVGDGADRRAELRRAVTLLYLAVPGDFVVLHLITSLFALEVIADRLDSAAERDRIHDLFWAGLRIIIAAERKIPDPRKLRALADIYPDTGPETGDLPVAEFEVAARRAWLEDEEHNPKLVFVLRQWWEEHRRPAYRHAAAQFTRTPLLPPSFDEPPND
ncbi:questin oxidase family protein [Nocardia speluncae]|uniref:Questin oxidase family protein n=1 Tax=Nocardia speluncae TaxID=419477 RepID=A0A846XFG6_9NOCA|nr:questin oxidase family protein [Nocardia speluncae]NKY33470.1 questin oxidase family protein [Nocardia speluncae]